MSPADGRGRPSGAAYVVEGSSMWLLLREGDVIRARPAAPEDLRRGDVLVLADRRRPRGERIVHRLLSKRRTPSGWKFRTRGDWARRVDAGDWAPVGRLDEIRRGGRSVKWRGARAALLGAAFLAVSRGLLAATAACRALRTALSPAALWPYRGSGPARLLLRRALLAAEPWADRARDAARSVLFAAADRALFGPAGRRSAR